MLTDVSAASFICMLVPAKCEPRFLSPAALSATIRVKKECLFSYSCNQITCYANTNKKRIATILTENVGCLIVMSYEIQFSDENAIKYLHANVILLIYMHFY